MLFMFKELETAIGLLIIAALMVAGATGAVVAIVICKLWGWL